jgi:hypothetical protein
MSRRLVTLLGAVLVVPTLASAQSPLPLGTPASETTATDEPARFTFKAPAAGVLLVVVNATSDITLRVTDADGQELPNGTVDGDLGGNPGMEMISLPLSEAGDYIVYVNLLSDAGSANFTINASFLTEKGFARPADPDKRPSMANEVQIAAPINGSLDPDAGDLWDWYQITAAGDGTLVFVTRTPEGSEGDLTLAAYIGKDFTTPTESSDQDLQGNAGNESITLNVSKGEVIYLKVNSLQTSGGKLEYRLSVGNVP